ncbi:MAG: hypothetical protein ACI30O_03955 [Muribaculaceae bacterium]
MAINFEAANMAGYNNPKIEIVTLLLDAKGRPENPPTYETMSKIIRRGVVPFLIVTDPNGYFYGVLPLSYYDNKNGFMIFSCSTQNTRGDEDNMLFISVKFRSGSDSPIVKNIVFSPAIN